MKYKTKEVWEYKIEASVLMAVFIEKYDILDTRIFYINMKRSPSS